MIIWFVKGLCNSQEIETNKSRSHWHCEIQCYVTDTEQCATILLSFSETPQPTENQTFPFVTLFFFRIVGNLVNVPQPPFSPGFVTNRVNSFVTDSIRKGRKRVNLIHPNPSTTELHHYSPKETIARSNRFKGQMVGSTQAVAKRTAPHTSHGALHLRLTWFVCIEMPDPTTHHRSCRGAKIQVRWPTPAFKQRADRTKEVLASDWCSQNISMKASIPHKFPNALESITSVNWSLSITIKLSAKLHLRIV